MLPLLQFLLLIAFPALAIVAAMRDATSFTIPNWISLALIGLYFPAALALGVPLPQIGLAVLVGFGARWANGCTSGHAIMGLAEGQRASLIATLAFFAGGLLATHLPWPLLLRAA